MFRCGLPTVCPRSAHDPVIKIDELERVQKIVQDQIDERLSVHAKVVPLAQAQAINSLRAVFGESYPDPVRVVCVGEDVANVVSDPGTVKR